MTRRTQQIVAAILAPLALLVALLAWGVSSPPGSSPDEDYHMGSIWCGNGPVEGRCELTRDPTVRDLPGDVVQAAACFAFHSGQAASCPLDETSLLPSARGNWTDHGYPPVFYSVMNVFVGPDMSVSVIVMRSFNALLFVGTLVALFFLLPLRMRHLLIWGALIAIVPLGVFLIPSINPSSWSVVQASGLWLAVSGFFVQTGRRKIGLAALSVLLMLIGAGARSDSAAYGVLAVAVAVVLGWRRDRRFFLELILPVILVIIAAAMFLTSGQSGVLTAETDRTQSVYSLIVANLQLLPQLWAGALGLWGLGWLDTPMPPLVWVLSIVLAGAVAFWGLRTGTPRKWVALLGVAAGLIVVPMYVLVREGVLVGTGVQPRYVYPLMIIFAGVILVGMRRTDLSLSRMQLAVVAIGLSIANSLALHVNMRRYITGLDGTGVNLDREAEWWWNTPITPMTVWIVGSLAFAVCLATLAWLASHHSKRALSPYSVNA